ncbi:hypothetical protein EUZ85_19600 [Hahella sp. KA22]|uniref:hypothetical protein n=1 Tax=Hahella sp. KA22 TaxID=1628392 RepID=UPI000FDD45D0|nr:hypothetical protein [Hahella sp. KA22]AZZ92810.1 hypothetical protein ENC22_17020 [Hahella sp. KA22]QAY56184.1 hypothetical protein EUZ85_19600 [Hahella sp. KA22]
MLKKVLNSVTTGKGPDFSQLTDKCISIGEYRLSYRLPSNRIQSGRPSGPKPDHINLHPDIFESYELKQEYNRVCSRLVFQWWSYKGFFLQGAFGQLCKFSMHIDINRISSQCSISENDLDSLEAYLKKDYWDYYETPGEGNQRGVNWRAREEFKDNITTKGEVPSNRLVHLPETYIKQHINGTNWLHYSLVGEGIPGPDITHYWAYPLNDCFYITICFWLTFEQGSKDARSERMLQDVNHIMSMVELEKS